MKQRRLRQPKICWNADDVDDSEYLVRIRWIKSVDAQKAKWKAKKGLFTTRLVRASLASQTKTLKFLESEFGIRFKDLVKE